MDTKQITSYRLGGHHLIERLPPGSLIQAAGACGIQNTPPGSAALSLHARIAGLTPGDLEDALYHEKTLLQAWNLRASPHIFPTQDAAIYSLGLLPTDEEAIRAYIVGAVAVLEKIKMSATQAIDLSAEAAWVELDGQTLTKDELGLRLASRIYQKLEAWQQSQWVAPSWVAAGQSLGESLVRYTLPVLALKGLCCHVEKRKNKAYIGRVDQWLDALPPSIDPEQAQAEIIRHYLRCYGPSTSPHFAGWAGISPVQAARTWKTVEPELVEIVSTKQKTWLLNQDLARFQSPTDITGIRFLPPHDPYLQLRDREMLVPDQAKRKIIWKTAGSPGVLLVDGDIAGIWRTHKTSRRLNIRIEWLVAVSLDARRRVEIEASSLAPFWDCLSVIINDFQL